jgi:hypothetical protein
MGTNGRAQGRRVMPVALLVIAAIVTAGSLAVTRSPGSNVSYSTALDAQRPGSDVIYGAPVPIGNGTARVYIDSRDGEPVEVGVVLSERALEGLPTHHSAGGVSLPDGHPMFEKILEMPAGNPTPYQYVALGWNPGGHEPPGVYDVPHFDFHFYTTPLDARRDIDPARPEYEVEAARHPAPEYVPAGYASIPDAVVPFMGAHWIDPRSPELNGEVFTRTFLYGSWNGEIIFAEPMITRAYLRTRPDVTQDIPVAARHATPGWYPASYRVRWIEAKHEYRVALGDFAWRN